jgi:MFS family permease
MSIINGSPSALAGSRARFGHGAGFWVLVAAFLTTVAFSTVPTPLYGLYQRRDGFPTFILTVVFATYAVGVMASLYLAAHTSDWFGRRRLLLLAVLAEALSAVVFLVSQDLAALLVARFVSGLGIGVLSATATVHLSELRVVARPEEDRSRSALIASAVNLGGLGLGPLVGGVLAQYVSSPLKVPYEIFLVLLLVTALAVVLVPETVEPSEVRPAYRPQRMVLPPAARPQFFGAAAGSFAAFAMAGLFTSVAPIFLGRTLHETSLLVAGAVSAGVFGLSAASQVALARVQRRQQLWIGLVAMSAGLVGIAAGGAIASLWLFVVSGLLGGAGFGLLVRGAIATAVSLADARSRGEVLAALFLISYVGLALPILGIGLALTVLSQQATLVVFSAVLLLLTVWSGARMLAPRPQVSSWSAPAHQG